MDQSVVAPLESAMLTGLQIRAGRALLKWSTEHLADKARIGIASVHRAEASDGMPNMQVRTLAAIKAALETGGVEFLDGYYTGSGGPGVRLKS